MKSFFVAGLAAFRLPVIIFKLTRKLKQSFEKALGKDSVIQVSQVMAGEDFGMYGRIKPIIPTSLFWLGSVNKTKYNLSNRRGSPLPSLHSDVFMPDPIPTINTGIKALTQAAHDLFNK